LEEEAPTFKAISSYLKRRFIKACAFFILVCKKMYNGIR